MITRLYLFDEMAFPWVSIEKLIDQSINTYNIMAIIRKSLGLHMLKEEVDPLLTRANHLGLSLYIVPTKKLLQKHPNTRAKAITVLQIENPGHSIHLIVTANECMPFI